MLLKERSSGKSVEILDLSQLFSLFEDEVLSRFPPGDNSDSSQNIKKSELIFTSGEELPRCWLDPHYRDDELKR